MEESKGAWKFKMTRPLLPLLRTRRQRRVPKSKEFEKDRQNLGIMFLLKCIAAFGLFSFVTFHAASTIGLIGKPPQAIIIEEPPPYGIVTWDNQTLYVHGERVLLYSGEFHPFRLPVPSLWLDVLQKIKAMGYNCVSFYINWALLEGKPGEFRAEGVHAWERLFEAASKAGIYLIARPGPYINAEASGGGFPGWLATIKGRLRTRDKDYMDSTKYYIDQIGKVIAKGQITNGGPVILLQPENEYTGANYKVPEFPDAQYMQDVMDAYRAAGIVVPFISNDAFPGGHNAPGTGLGAVDIYGHDGYPLGFDCTNPYTWPNGYLPTYFRSRHMAISPSTPYSVLEFQGGSFDEWGGPGFEQCSQLINHEFERVFYKNMFASGVTIFNIYMTYGGTNWGNLGHPDGYTSYDYGSVLREDRRVDREKYSEAKLQASFLRTSTAYMTSIPQLAATNWTNTVKLTVTPLFDSESASKFWVLRHTAYNSLAKTPYRLKVQTSHGLLKIPLTNGSATLSLNGRDSKVHVTDHNVGGYNLLYSSAEIFTWKKSDKQTHLIVYGGPGEFHELAFSGLLGASSSLSASGQSPFRAQVVVGDESSVSIVEGDTIAAGVIIISYTASADKKIIKVTEDLYVHLLDRNTAYNYWLSTEPGALDLSKAVIVSGPYLTRSAKISGPSVYITGDLNSTITLEVIGQPSSVKYIYFNGKKLATTVTDIGSLSAPLEFIEPTFNLPDLKTLDWRYQNSLPELEDSYDDSKWTVADKIATNNPRDLTTPTNLYASDYGYHTGSLIYRGYFTATGNETTLRLWTAGGSAFGMATWLNGKHIGSWPGINEAASWNTTFALPKLKAGTKATITVLIDHMGMNQNGDIGAETMKFPRGILDYNLVGRKKSDVTWKLTGNLGGEDYQDKVRGPLNEGGIYAERQGWHQPSAPTGSWPQKSPFDGISSAGVGFYTTSFNLALPPTHDIPLQFTFTNVTSPTPHYRAQIYVNGWQYAKYVHNVGPQGTFPVPQGILDYQGTNYIAVALWALDGEGGKVDELKLEAAATGAQWDFGVETVVSPRWEKRGGAY